MLATYRTLKDQEFAAALQLRISVFVDEQKVPLEEEHDSFDQVAQHFGVFVEGRLVGTGRLVREDNLGRIGRLAILPKFRGLRLGSGLVSFIVETGKHQGIGEFVLGAQLQAIPFYEQLGFTAEGEVFQDGGIPHRTMRYVISDCKEVKK
ncbi:MAG: GNAT family N-acetyltransferase [Firmicutes bacterium]|mgnify:CR=1 FL=1|nr:GNAT family N-acetyltransferase [Bacillota bacterium]